MDEWQEMAPLRSIVNTGRTPLKHEHCNSQVIVESTIPGSPLFRWVVSVGVSTSSTCCGKPKAPWPSIRPAIADTAKLGIMFAANQ